MNRIFFSFLLIYISGTSVSAASGGWVGNSPINVAYYRPDVFGANFYSAEVSSQQEWNSLLLPKGQSRLSFEWGQLNPKYFSSTYYLDFSWQYAFTEKLTTNTLLNWGYSLLSGNGRGHEVAAYFGLYGLGYSTTMGMVAAPGFGLGYAYTEGPWRFTTRTIAVNSYYFKDSDWGRLQIQLDGDVTFQWNDIWSTGLGLKANITAADTQQDIFTLRDSQVFLRPSFIVNRAIKDFGYKKQDLDLTLGLGLDDIRNSTIGVSWSF